MPTTTIGWMGRVCGSVVLVMSTFGVSAGVAPLHAQQSDGGFLDVRGGAGIALDDLGELSIEEVGPAFGLGIGVRLSPQLALRVDADAILFPGDTQDEDDPPTGEIDGPDMRLLHLTAGADLRLTPASWGLNLTAQVGGGITQWEIDRFDVGAGPVEFSEVYPTAMGGILLGYAFSPNVDLYLGSRAYVTFADEQDTRMLVGIMEPEDEDDDDAEEDDDEIISEAMSLPIYIGIRWTP